MSSVVSFDARRELRARAAVITPAIEITLLGCGTVGSALAALTRHPHPAAIPVRITAALVRDARRARPALPGDVLRTNDVGSILSSTPDVVVEVLGGTEPARTIVLAALERGIPVVTANKSLLAAHGRELRETAALTSTPLLYEAAVVAGVPFLGTFARRAYASQLTSVVGIANGTTNYILTRATADRVSIAAALLDAQRLGLAEPDPSKDVEGIDAAEKLTVLLQHFALADVRTQDIETEGITALGADDLERAAELGGTIKPVVAADWSNAISAFAGPAFVSHTHVLASVDSAENALLFEGGRGRLLFRGRGAGPEVTAATVLDDVQEAWRGGPQSLSALSAVRVSAPETEWLISVKADRLPRPADVADLLASHGVYLRRTGSKRTRGGVESIGALSWPASRGRVATALRALESAAGCTTSLIRALED
jgi:homoserine dehydrogenase